MYDEPEEEDGDEEPDFLAGEIAADAEGDASELVSPEEGAYDDVSSAQGTLLTKTCGGSHCKCMHGGDDEDDDEDEDDDDQDG